MKFGYLALVAFLFGLSIAAARAECDGQKAVNSGDEASNAGDAFLKGDGAPRNYAKAYDCYAAALYQPRGRYGLAYIYYYGLGRPRDEKKALHFTFEAQKGWRADDIRDLHAVASAYLMQAEMYAKGEAGLPKDSAKSRALIHTAASYGDERALRTAIEDANGGDPGAQAALGSAYAAGYGVPRDLNLAQTWYLKSANQGFTGGMDGMWSITRDPKRVYFWCRLSERFTPNKGLLFFLFGALDGPCGGDNLTQLSEGEQRRLDRAVAAWKPTPKSGRAQQQW